MHNWQIQVSFAQNNMQTIITELVSLLNRIKIPGKYVCTVWNPSIIWCLLKCETLDNESEENIGAWNGSRKLYSGIYVQGQKKP